MPKKPNKKENQKIAKERILELFKQADLTKSQELANRYVFLARKIAMKYNIRSPRELKRKFCKHCYNYFKSGKNFRTRLRDKKVIYYCLNCKKSTYYPYLKEKKTK